MSRHRGASASCRLFPSKRTFISAVCTSAKCQLLTSRAQIYWALGSFTALARLSGPGASDVVPAEDANHPLIFVDHRQPADLQLFHVRGRLLEVIILSAAMDA